jgi:uncharacterized membrane protein YhaH (DUF805 family)
MAELSTNNPYAAPRAQVADVAEDAATQPVRFWPPKGRLGRLRYVAYGLAIWLGVSLLSGVLVGLLAVSSSSGGEFFAWLPAVLGVTIIALTFPLTIQRLHDLNWNGWLSVLMFVPFLNMIFGLILVFVPGTKGTNRYGALPPPNSGVLKLLVSLLLGLMVLGIAAAIALPAYSDYTQRARAAQSR